MILPICILICGELFLLFWLVQRFPVLGKTKIWTGVEMSLNYGQCRGKWLTVMAQYCTKPLMAENESSWNIHVNDYVLGQRTSVPRQGSMILFGPEQSSATRTIETLVLSCNPVFFIFTSMQSLSNTRLTTVFTTLRIQSNRRSYPFEH